MIGAPKKTDRQNTRKRSKDCIVFFNHVTVGCAVGVGVG